MGHLPVCGWTRVATGTIKRRASAVTKGWDDETTDDLLVRMVKETIARVKQDDPAKGDWCVQGDELNVWVDASSLAIGVLLELRLRTPAGCDRRMTLLTSTWQSSMR